MVNNKRNPHGPKRLSQMVDTLKTSDCPRSAPPVPLLPSAAGPARQWTASEYPGSVGTSSICSAFCGTDEWQNAGRPGPKRNQGHCDDVLDSTLHHLMPPTINPGVSRICTMATTSASSSTVHCWTFSCGPCGSPQTGWPGTAGLFVVQLEELRLRGGCSRNLAV